MPMPPTPMKYTALKSFMLMGLVDIMGLMGLVGNPLMGLMGLMGLLGLLGLMGELDDLFGNHFCRVGQCQLEDVCVKLVQALTIGHRL